MHGSSPDMDQEAKARRQAQLDQVDKYSTNDETLIHQQRKHNDAVREHSIKKYPLLFDQ